ncbi:MAG TPA: hypothetical protein VG963_13415 [Polyangiaceae bacterium]|nr:hypothetical protein [Polyangiaceae bacterium]
MLFAALAGCARFGFERVDADAGAGLGGPLVTTGSAGAGGNGLAGQGGTAAAGSGGAGGNAGQMGTGAAPGGVDAGATDAGATDVPPDASTSCFDGVRNGDELGVDCGGSQCDACASCTLGSPQLLGQPNYSDNDLWSPRLSGDGLTLYFGLTITGLKEQIALATRPDPASEWSLGQTLPAPVNDSGEGTPYVSLDGLRLYFYSERSGGAGTRDLYLATRASDADDFAGVTPLSSLNTPVLDYLPWLSPDELTIYFCSGSSGSADILRATRSSIGAAFDPAVPVSELNSSSDENGITLTADGLEAILSSNRPGSAGKRDLFRATRVSASDPFSTPLPLDALNSADNEIDPAFSPDGTELYFASSRGGTKSQLYRVTRSCTR